MSGLSAPWDLAFITEGHILFTEKCRGLSVRRNNGSVSRLFGTNWRDWSRRLAVGVIKSKRIDILELDSNDQVVGVTTAHLPSDRPRSLVMGPRGDLYVATDSGSIWRVTPN